MTNREAFEKWYKEVYWDFSTNSQSRTMFRTSIVAFNEDKQSYNHFDVDLAWNAWCAAKVDVFQACGL